MSEEWITKVQTSLSDTEQSELDDSWNGMPEFVQEKDGAYRKIIMSFKTEQDAQDFSKLINQRVTDKTKSLWFPAKEKNESIFKWVEDED